jgi:hypothetical protein
MSKIPKKPTKQLVKRYLREFRESERYFLSDRAITTLFEMLPHNNTLDHVLLKVTVLNDLYGTNIYGTFDMARHICSLHIDTDLRKRSTEVVDRIADARFSGKPRQVFSFATKYCSWHDKDNYPLYDNYVEKLLMAYRRKDHFATFKKTDLRCYASFKAVITAFRMRYRLTQYSFKQLDKFLWLYGKHLFQKQYGKTNGA